mmetsp:Transcript_32183/g.69163  ORF Transcript_32183/g.69163 Transcript_32183/m.69163 type:complete len:214 (-) Transcript_32183:214-855(-)
MTLKAESMTRDREMRTFCRGRRPSRNSERSDEEEVPPSCECCCSRCSARERPNAVEWRKSRRASKLKRNVHSAVSALHQLGSEREHSASGSCNCRKSLALSLRLTNADGGSAASPLVPSSASSVAEKRQVQCTASACSSQSSRKTLEAGSVDGRIVGNCRPRVQSNGGASCALVLTARTAASTVERPLTPSEAAASTRLLTSGSLDSAGVAMR